MNCLDEAWKQHESELRNWMRHQQLQPQDADDLMQEIFLKAMRQGNRFCEVSNARAWLFEVARNALTDRFRARRNLVELPDDLVSEVVDPDAVDRLSACLPRVLSELSPADREAIYLCDLEGMSQAEYAAKAGLTLSAAKSRLQRARQKMRDRMTQACQVKLDAHGRVEDFVPRPPLDSLG